MGVSDKRLRGHSYGSQDCPRCLKEKPELGIVDRLKMELKETYGKIPLADWQFMEHEMKRIESERNIGWAKPLHYRYSLGMSDDGKFILHYECKCQDCGFEFHRDLDEPAT